MQCYRPRAPQQYGMKSTRNQSVNAVSSVGKGALQLYADVTLNGQLIPRTLIDTGATFSLIPLSTYHQLRQQPPIINFSGCVPNIIGVGGALAVLKGYIDVPIEISGVEVLHPLVVVEHLAFPLLIGMDVLCPHNANFVLGSPDSVRLLAPLCEVCLETRSPDDPKFCEQPAVVSTLGVVNLKPFCAATISVRVPPTVLSSNHFCVERIDSLLFNYGCAVLPCVCSVSGGTSIVSIINISGSVVTLRESTPVKSAHPIEISTEFSSENVSAMHHLSHEEKLKKVLSELRIDDVQRDREAKIALRKFVSEFLDSFAV